MRALKMRMAIISFAAFIQCVRKNVYSILGKTSANLDIGLGLIAYILTRTILLGKGKKQQYFWIGRNPG